jgi:hypothetical protein
MENKQANTIDQNKINKWKTIKSTLTENTMFYLSTVLECFLFCFDRLCLLFVCFQFVYFVLINCICLFVFHLFILLHFSSHFSQQLLMTQIWYMVTSFISETPYRGKRFWTYGIPIWSLWPNIRFLPSIVAEESATKNILDGRKDRRTEVKQYTPSPSGEWGYKKYFNWKYQTIDDTNLIYSHKLHIGNPISW